MSEITAPETFDIRFPSRLELLSLLDRLTMLLCERLSFDEDAASQVTLSVIEAGTNAIQHGHRRDPSLPVHVTYTLHPDHIEVTVRDRGAGFDLDALNGDVTAPEHLLDARGRGIFIMRACMDSVDFEFGPDGTVCRLVKRLAAPPAAPGEGA